MPTIINAKNLRNAEGEISEALASDNDYLQEISSVVSGIINDVRDNGDKALIKYTKKFDGWNVNIKNLRVTEKEINLAVDECSDKTVLALELAAKRIGDYHAQQKPDNVFYKDHDGVKLGWKWTSIESAGLYVPGGLASYPSSVLMNAIPAKTAGVSRIAMMVPAPYGKISPLVLVAAKIAGIEEIYKIGGAQAIAALAYGTEKIKPVSKIVGPGNAYVAEAKRQVFGKVGIDMIAGPSEILVISDNNSNPDWIAADLLSQAEHDENARSILITDNKDFAEKVVSCVNKHLKGLKRKEIAAKSWEKNGIIIITEDLENAAEIANFIAPEHIELALEDPYDLSRLIYNAGAIFMGRYTPEAIGDYTAGPSHVLPTSGTARFSSGLSVYDFMKRTSLILCDEKSFKTLSEKTAHLAEKEGLDAHALSIKLRS